MHPSIVLNGWLFSMNERVGHWGGIGGHYYQS